MSVYIDAVTVTLAIVILVIYSRWMVVSPNCKNILGFLACVFYLFAQSGWTVAFFEGDVWGRDFSNYIWFLFNTTVFLLILCNWIKREKK